MTAIGITALMSAGLATAVALATPATAAATNLLTNAGFETADLSGWTCDSGTASVVGSPAHSGSHALAGTPSSSADAQRTQTVSAQPNTAYTLSGYVQGS